MGRANSLEKTLMLGKLKAGGGGDDRVWNGWMTSLTQWTWVWTSSGSWWWTGKPSVLKSMGSQTVGTELLNWIELNWILRTDNGSTIQYVLFIQMFSQSMLRRLYVSLEICLSSRFMSVVLCSWVTLCQCYLKMHVACEGPGTILWVLRNFLSLISILLVGI